jgi:hypothetical protein
MRRLASSLIFGLILLMLPRAALPAGVKLRATPQKFRAFYASEDARVPAHIRRQLVELQTP